ncbi:MAG TPA: hypothetical protein VGF84_20960 [Micromonosporaceae bacterium]|jgi:hypothetical protein
MSMAWDATAVIDLDVGAAPTIEPTPARPRGPLRSWRYRIAVPLCAIVLGLGASTPAPGAPFPQVARFQVGDGASLLVHDDRAYVLEIDGRHNVLRSYPLTGRGRGWTVPVAELPADAQMRAAGDTIVVSMNPEQVTGPIHTEVFDAVSGRRLWASPYGTVGLAGTDDVLLESMIRFPMTGIPNTPSAVGGWTVKRVAARTGSSRWTAGIPLGCDQAFVRDPAHGMPEGLAELCSDAPVLRVLDLSTGRQRAQRDIPVAGEVPIFPPPPLEAPMPPQMIVYGDVVVVTHVRDSAATIDAYQGADLRSVWPSIVYAPWQDVTDCDDYLCLLSNTEPIVIDPRTGKELHGPAAQDAITPRSAGILIAADGAQPRLRDFHSVSTVGDGIAEAVPTPDVGSAWITRSATGPGLEKLDGIGPTACVQMDHYLACSPSLGFVTIWHVA